MGVETAYRDQCGVGASGELKKIAMIPQEDSLGEIYAVTTHLLGFMPLEHEYKLMGMAPYASEEHAKSVAGIFRTYLDLDEKESLAIQEKGPRAARMDRAAPAERSRAHAL